MTESDWLASLPPGGRSFRLDVPANLLLCGEYAITEPEGQGIWLAAEPDDGRRAFLECHPAASFGLTLRWPGANSSWSLTTPPPAMLQAVLDGLDDLASRGTLTPNTWLGPWSIELDTSAFFSPDGRKLGLGSSAAACLLLSAALLHLNLIGQSADKRVLIWRDFPAWSVANHRRFQGGRGSGYDILCSLYGGMGLFTGGSLPRGQRLPDQIAARLPPFKLVPGAQTVRTGSAIDAWRIWKATHPGQAVRYLETCRHNVAGFLALAPSNPGDSTEPPSSPPPSSQQIIALLEQARLAGVSIGESIGVPATVDNGVPEGAFAKALGAGNETIMVIERDSLLPASGEPRTPGSPNASSLTTDRIAADRSCRYRVALRGLRARPILASGLARAKLLLFGEHVALFGWPAVGTPLDEACRVSFCPDDTATDASCRFPDLPGKLAAAATQVLERALAAIPKLVLPQGHFLVSSTIPTGSGYGSSAAFSAALAATLLKLEAMEAGWPAQGAPGTSQYRQGCDQQLWEFANHLDGHFHGKASGIDTGLAIACGPCAFLPKAGETPGIGLERRGLHRHEQSGELWIVHATLPRSSNTRDLVATVRRGFEAGDPRFVHGLASLGRISQSAIGLLDGNGSASDLGELADQAQAILGNLGLSCQELEAALTMGRAAGASGGKLSGAGGGGAFYLWAPDESTARRIASALDTSGLPLTSPPRCLALALTNADNAASCWNGNTPAAG